MGGGDQGQESSSWRFHNSVSSRGGDVRGPLRTSITWLPGLTSLAGDSSGLLVTFASLCRSLGSYCVGRCELSRVVGRGGRLELCSFEREATTVIVLGPKIPQSVLALVNL